MGLFATRARRHAIAAVLVMGLFGEHAAAQNADSMPITPNLYRVAGLVGYQWFDESSALDNAPFIGMRISRGIGRMFSGGLSVAFARPTTKGEYFPWNRQIYFSDASHQNDTTLLFQVEQRVTIATSTLDLGFGIGGESPGGGRFALGGVRASVNVGAGFWAVWLDPERTKGNNGHGGMAFPIGGGIMIPVGRGASLGARIDDVILTNFYRDMFSLSDPLLSEDLFLNPLVTPPPPKTPIHNMRLTFAFSFVPGVKEQ
jgi:hypothetical protein